MISLPLSGRRLWCCPEASRWWGRFSRVASRVRSRWSQRHWRASFRRPGRRGPGGMRRQCVTACFKKWNVDSIDSQVGLFSLWCGFVLTDRDAMARVSGLSRGESSLTSCHCFATNFSLINPVLLVVFWKAKASGEVVCYPDVSLGLATRSGQFRSGTYEMK